MKSESYTITTALEQIEKCDFECEGGPLANNTGYRWLKGFLESLGDVSGVLHTFRDYADDMATGALRGRDGQSYAAIGQEDRSRVDALLAKLEAQR